MEHHLAKVGVAGSIPVSRFFFCVFYVTGIEPARGFGLRSAPVGAKRTSTGRPAPRLALLFLRRRQAKVPDSCLHEMKALWRPPDIEHEMRDGGGDAGWVVWRLAAYYPLFLGPGIGPARGLALHGRHWRPAPCSAPVGVNRVPLARSGLRSAPVGAKRVPQARSTVSRFFFCVITWLSRYAAAIFSERWRRSSLFNSAFIHFNHSLHAFCQRFPLDFIPLMEYN